MLNRLSRFNLQHKKQVVLTSFYVVKRFASGWILNDYTLAGARKLADDFISSNKSHPMVKDVSFTHNWEKDSTCPNSYLLTFKVQKAGTSTIKFKVTEHNDPLRITINEHSRELSFFHSAFASTIDSQIDNVITSLGAKST